MATDAQHQLFVALAAHRLELETERDAASEHDQVVLDLRLEAARRLLEWASTALKLGSPNGALDRCG